MKVLFLITARGGSKGVPGKNLRRIHGLSLVGYKAVSASRSRYCSRLIISTDSPEIQSEARAHGVEVPFTRPAELASDTAKSGPVIAHAMEWIEREGHSDYNAVMLLEPSSPFARARDYDAAVELMMAHDADAVVGVTSVHASSTVIGPLGPSGELTAIVDKMHAAREQAGQRQTLGVEYTMNGALYLFKWDYFKQHQWIYHDREKVFGYVMDPLYSVEIDEPRDLLWAEFLAGGGHLSLGEWIG
jgi:CMP-N,N'-diacetyllegionaminic acid synthase